MRAILRANGGAVVARPGHHHRITIRGCGSQHKGQYAMTITVAHITPILALIGGIVALFISGTYLSVPGSIGFIALFGVAVLNGVVMVNAINNFLGHGNSVDDAVSKGALSRLRPVLMTAMIAALGLIPLLLASGVGSEVQRPLATVVIGGLVSSTLLTLVVLPAAFRWFSRGVLRDRARWHELNAAAAPAE